MANARRIDFGNAAFGIFLIWLVPAAYLLAATYGLFKPGHFQLVLGIAFLLPVIQLISLGLSFIFGTEYKNPRAWAALSFIPILSLLDLILSNFIPK